MRSGHFGETILVPAWVRTSDRPARTAVHIPTTLSQLPSNTNQLLTPWSRVLIEKLTGSQLDKKFPAFYGTKRFVTAFTHARHLPLS